MSTFAYFLTTLLIGGLLCICAYLGDRIIELEKRAMRLNARRVELDKQVEDLIAKIRHLEAF